MGRHVAPIDPARKAAALRVAAEHGAAEAERQTGVRASTIRAWRSREGAVDRTPSGDDQELRRVTAQTARETALKAVRRMEAVIQSAKSPQSLAIAAGILVDKAAMLDAQVIDGEVHRNHLLDRFAQDIVELFKLYSTALGLPSGPEFPGIDVFTELLKSTQTGVMVCSPATAEHAAAATREHFRKQLEAEIRAQIEAEQRPQLLAGDSQELHDFGSHPEGGGADVQAEIFLDGSEEVDGVVEDLPVRRVLVGAVDRGGPDLGMRQPSKWRI